MEVITPMALIIDTTRCQGHGRCALINPDLFEVDDDGFGRLRAAQQDVPGRRWFQGFERVVDCSRDQRCLAVVAHAGSA